MVPLDCQSLIHIAWVVKSDCFSLEQSNDYSSPLLHDSTKYIGICQKYSLETKQMYENVTVGDCIVTTKS